jgi:flagellar assembly protein FliH
MAFTQLVSFDRPLAGAARATRPTATPRLYTEEEVIAREQAAHERGAEAARLAADQRLVELRSAIAQLSEGALRKLEDMEPRLLAEVREALPALAVEISRRLLAGHEPSAEVVDRLCREALEHLFPERDCLEVSLSPRDAELLQGLNPDWLGRYPDLRIKSDVALRPGDCLVRSRFGLTDARQETKLAALSHSLTGA